MIAIAAAGGLLVIASLLLVRLFAGPTLYDRALVAVSLNTKIALIIASLGVAFQRPSLIDHALVQAAVGFIVGLAAVKLLRYRSFQTSLEQDQSAGGAETSS